MRRATGRHNQSAGDVYAEHPAIPVPAARLQGARRAERVIFLAILLLAPVVVALVLAVPAQPYWDQPDQRAVITAGVPAGTLTEGKVTCDASRFTVRGPAGRTGSFRDCDDERAIGDEVVLRWRSDTSTEVRVDVLTAGRIALIGALVAVACALIGAVVLRGEQRRRERSAFPTYRTRQG